MIRFYAAPAWELGKPSAETLEPAGAEAELIPEAFKRSEYRGQRPLEKASKVLADGGGPPIFAQPPKDLPALLRLADQLLLLAVQDAGERAKVWRCECGTRYAVPVSLLRPGSIKCERCGQLFWASLLHSAEVRTRWKSVLQHSLPAECEGKASSEKCCMECEMGRVGGSETEARKRCGRAKAPC